MEHDFTLWNHFPVVLRVGDWSVRYNEGRCCYALSCYGNFIGWFNTPEEVESHLQFPRGQEIAQKLRVFEAKKCQVTLGI